MERQTDQQRANSFLRMNAVVQHRQLLNVVRKNYRNAFILHCITLVVLLSIGLLGMLYMPEHKAIWAGIAGFSSWGSWARLSRVKDARDDVYNTDPITQRKINENPFNAYRSTN